MELPDRGIYEPGMISSGKRRKLRGAGIISKPVKSPPIPGTIPGEALGPALVIPISWPPEQLWVGSSIGGEKSERKRLQAAAPAGQGLCLGEFFEDL